MKRPLSKRDLLAIRIMLLEADAMIAESRGSGSKAAVARLNADMCRARVLGYLVGGATKPDQAPNRAGA
jgi:hypothetical protein